MTKKKATEKRENILFQWPPKKWDVVIIGGGLAGYVAANFLGKTGLSVLLLEKSGRVGGRAVTDKVKENYFNLGPHALYKKGNAKAILEELNIQLAGKSPNTRGTLVENNILYDAPFSPLGLLTTKRLNGKERLEWIKVLLKLKNIYTKSLVNVTFEQWVEQTTTSKMVRSLLYILGRLATYCHSPNKTSAKVVVSHMKLAIGGAIYLDGGWQTIIDQLHHQAVSLGIQIQTQAIVKQITPGVNGYFHLLLSNDEEIYGKNVIYTAEPYKLNALLKDASDDWQTSFYDQVKPVMAASLDVALKELPYPKRLFAMGIKEPFYYSVHSAYARLSEEESNIVLHVLKYYPTEESINRKEVKTELKDFLQKVQPGWQEYEITSRTLPHIIVNHRLPQVGEEGILQHSETGISGLYIAGDWASPDWILSEGAISSGKQAAEEIMERGWGRSSAN